jgi:xylose isomerase
VTISSTIWLSPTVRETAVICTSGGGISARRLKIAAAMRADEALEQLLEDRCASWSSPLGKRIEAGTESFASLE